MARGKKGLTEKIKDAFVESTHADHDGTKDTGGGDTKKIEKLSEDLADAIIEWVLDQTFTITEMNAMVEIDEIKTVAPFISKTIAPVTGIPNGGGPVMIAPAPFIFENLNLSKKGGGQGGMTVGLGHAKIGRKSSRIPKSDTVGDAGGWNKFTKVKLDPEKIKNR